MMSEDEAIGRAEWEANEARAMAAAAIEAASDEAAARAADLADYDSIIDHYERVALAWKHRAIAAGVPSCSADPDCEWPGEREQNGCWVCHEHVDDDDSAARAGGEGVTRGE